jgi:NAD(P)-dependent dehydrogenase (short-subunit alcohol dehydrogenase family)
MTQPLQGRRILVTGGATGIGAAAVQVLSKAGAAVVATYHRTTPPDHAGVSWVQCDVRDPSAVNDMVSGAAETLGGLDVLLHAAGLWQPGVPGHITGENIDFLVDTNLKATIFTNQSAYAVMRKDGGKGAVAAWTRSIARAWAAEKVSAIALAPAVHTPGADRLREFLGPAAADFIDEQISRRFPSAGHWEIRSATSGRRWCSWPARDPASSPDS